MLKLNFPIATISDVTKFFDYLHIKESLSFHPDDNFADYIGEDKKKLYSPSEAEHLNFRMNIAHNICKAAEVDIYDLAMKSYLTYQLVQHIRFTRTREFQHNMQIFAGIRAYVETEYADTENNSLAVYFKDVDTLMRSVLTMDSID